MTRKSAAATAASIVLMMLSVGALRAQSPSPRVNDPGVASDDMLTLVVGTRFVTASASASSPHALFNDARIPLADFNETDHCLDKATLEVAQEYFTDLGRILGKAGHFYFVPDDAIRKAVTMCERLLRQPPRAWIEGKTKIIAFGRVVPTADARAIEQSIR